MTDRRGHHEGTFDVLPDGRVRWKVRVRYQNGKTARPSGTARNITEARQAVREAQAAAEGTRQPVAHKLTVLELVTEYMEAKKGVWSYRSYKNNEYLLEHYIKGPLGSLRAAGVSPRTLREYFEGLSLGRSGQNQIRSLLSGAYKRAIADDLLRENPTIHTSITKARRVVAKKSFTPEEARLFYAAALKDRWAWPLAFMLLTGMRIGEAVALTWADVGQEKDDGSVYVLVNKTRSEYQGHAYENSPKTAAGTRKVYLSEDAQTLLRQLHERAKLEAEGHGNGIGPYIFPSPKTGKPMKHDTLRGVMDRICRVAGVQRLTPHGLRHSFTSLMHAQGGTLTAISASLGHAQVSTTLSIYRHVFDSERRQVVLNLSESEDKVPPPAKTEDGKWLN